MPVTTALTRIPIPNNLDLILETLDPFKDQLRELVVESTYNWYWLVDGLMDAG